MRRRIEPDESGCVVGNWNDQIHGGRDGKYWNNSWPQPGPAKVAGGQDHEVKYEAGKTGASKAEVKSAVKSVGNSRKKVEEKLRQEVNRRPRRMLACHRAPGSVG